MGKRSDFERRERDFYPTPREAVIPLARFIQKGTRFAEPCAGNGILVKHLEDLVENSKCVYKADIEPASADIEKADAFDIDNYTILTAHCIITNPPWDRKILHPMIEHFANIRPTWLLFDADWMHTKQSSELVKNYLTKIVSVGRVKWIEGSKMTGKDNVCWYHFWRHGTDKPIFMGR